MGHEVGHEGRGVGVVKFIYLGHQCALSAHWQVTR